MSPETETDQKANEWFNTILAKLRFEQDYYIFPGSSEKIMDGDRQSGISIKRPDVRLYSTGVNKLYQILVEGLELPDVEYTPEQEDKFDKNMRERFPDAFRDEEAEGDETDNDN